MNEQVSRLQSAVDRLLAGRQGIWILEAGCGSASYLRWHPTAHIVGIDISEKQLQRNPVIGERILGDIQSYELPSAAFDAIVCWDVLEHLPQPERALASFSRAIKEDGIIILALPNVLSLRSLVTKLTPYRFHVWAYRTFYNDARAGTEDWGPFPTYLRFSLAPAALRRFALAHGLAVEYESTYESGRQRKLRERYGLVGWRWRLLKRATRIVSLGRVNAELTDCVVVLRKRRATTR